jgi:hypothetical protein
MTAKRPGVPGTDECLTRLDDAFAKLEYGLAAAQRREDSAAPDAAVDYAEIEEALDRIDQQLNGASSDTPEPEPPARVQACKPSSPIVVGASDAPALEAPARVTLALVATPPAAAVEPALAAGETGDELEALWDKREEGTTALERLVGTLQNLLWLQRAINSQSTKVAQHMRWERVAGVLDDARELCEEFDLSTARVRAKFALDAFESDRLELLAVEVAELLRHIHHDLRSCTMLPIPQPRASMLGLALDAPTAEAFPTSAIEVADAGRCMALGLYGAAVFHLLRAAEPGRVALARAVRVNAQSPEATDWARTIVCLQKRVDALRRWPAGPARKAAKDFLATMLSDARGLDDVWRRVGEGEIFQQCHAEATWLTTRHFLNAASERVSEAADTLLTADDFIPRP